MGIVNLNDDSFSGDGSLIPDEVWRRTMQQIEHGADIIDIGAESARTNRGPISWQQEVERLRPFLTQWQSWSRDQPDTKRPWLSINTWRAEVIEAALPLGGDLVNDMSALTTPANAELCARHDAALLIMHSVGLPKQAHDHVHYPDIMAELERFFAARIATAQAAGLGKNQLVLDPGIDFAKQREDNLRLIRELPRLARFGVPVLLPVSRKTVIGQVLGIDEPLRRDPGSMACLVAGLMNGASIFRVHNVKAARDAVAAVMPLLARETVS